jgi:hypothetical protein
VLRIAAGPSPPAVRQEQPGTSCAAQRARRAPATTPSGRVDDSECVHRMRITRCHSTGRSKRACFVSRRSSPSKGCEVPTVAE